MWRYDGYNMLLEMIRSNMTLFEKNKSVSSGTMYAMNNLLAEAKDVTSSKANSTVNCLIKSIASVGKHNYVNSCKFSYQLVIPLSRFTNIHDNTTQPYLTLSMKAHMRIWCINNSATCRKVYVEIKIDF